MVKVWAWARDSVARMTLAHKMVFVLVVTFILLIVACGLESQFNG
jgi:hypothetical protein